MTDSAGEFVLRHRTPEEREAYMQNQLVKLVAENARLKERVADYENGISWDTSCTNCAKLLDRCYAADMASVSADVLAMTEQIDAWLDAGMAEEYKASGLALRWLRVAKCAGEAGEVIEALTTMTGGNPRKPAVGTEDDLLGELADVYLTALCAIQHVTKDRDRTRAVIGAVFAKVMARVAEFPEGGVTVT